jgi:tubulin--tyrosine ligase/tubulin polyglutamylase TTLL9
VGNGSGVKQMQSKMKYFEIFGYDFMVDCSKHVWLIEVNTNPCIELSNKWLTTIIPRMLDDAFKLTIDRIFPKKKAAK